MANTIDWGQAAVNNTNGFGKAATNNTIDFGEICADSWSPETNLVGGSSFSNTQSIELDGIDAFVEVADSDNLSFGNGTTDSPFSVSAWVKMDTVNNFIIVSKDATSQREYAFRMVNDTIRVFLLDNSSGGYIGRFYNSSLSSLQGVWSHFCFTYNGNSASNGVKIYLNATRVDDSNYQGGTYTSMENTSSSFNIGRQEASNSDSNGNIDEVAIFDSELSASDVSAIGGTIPTDLSAYNPISWWRFEGTGTTATDSGSGGNDGLLDNTVVRSTDVPT
jgi:hypothetical protein